MESVIEQRNDPFHLKAQIILACDGYMRLKAGLLSG